MYKLINSVLNFYKAFSKGRFIGTPVGGVTDYNYDWVIRLELFSIGGAKMDKLSKTFVKWKLFNINLLFVNC